MDCANNTCLKNNITDEMILNLRTENCYFVRSQLYDAQSTRSWKEYISNLADKQVLYYIDAKKVLQEADINNIRKRLVQTNSYTFHFRANYEQHFEWFSATIIEDEKDNNGIISARIIIEIQNLFYHQQDEASNTIFKEILLKGFGSAYSNLIWIDVNNDSYKMFNTFGNVCDVELIVQPNGSYTEDNKGYAINGVYKDDWDTFYQYTSLEWYREHLKKEGDRFSFLIRQIYNGEYRWVEINVVCTRRDQQAFHVFFWLDDVNDKVYDNTAMKDTLASVEVGQWRFELRNGCTETFTASPSLMRVIGISDTKDGETFWKELKNRVYFEDRLKIKERFFQLANNEETSFTFRFNHKTKGLRYYRCGVTCIAKNDIYTCYQGYGQDITEIMQPMISSVKQAEAMSFVDKLTDLYNRNYLESHTENFIQKNNLPVSLIMSDCNYLKRTNDTLGHEYGDLLLQRLASCIQSSLPEGSVAIRIGGDEFLIVCTNCSAEKATSIINSIRQKMTEYSDKVIKLSASFGTYTVEDVHTPFRYAYDMADHAMYKEKAEHHKLNS